MTTKPSGYRLGYYPVNKIKVDSNSGKGDWFIINPYVYEKLRDADKEHLNLPEGRPVGLDFHCFFKGSNYLAAYINAAGTLLGSRDFPNVIINKGYGKNGGLLLVTHPGRCYVCNRDEVCIDVYLKGPSYKEERESVCVACFESDYIASARSKSKRKKKEKEEKMITSLSQVRKGDFVRWSESFLDDTHLFSGPGPDNHEPLCIMEVSKVSDISVGAGYESMIQLNCTQSCGAHISEVITETDYEEWVRLTGKTPLIQIEPFEVFKSTWEKESCEREFDPADPIDMDKERKLAKDILDELVAEGDNSDETNSASA